MQLTRRHVVNVAAGLALCALLALPFAVHEAAVREYDRRLEMQTAMSVDDLRYVHSALFATCISDGGSAIVYRAGPFHEYIRLPCSVLLHDTLDIRTDGTARVRESQTRAAFLNVRESCLATGFCYEHKGGGRNVSDVAFDVPRAMPRVVNR